MPAVYKIHRRLQAPLCFKGFKGQYILYAGALVVGTLFLSALLYVIGLGSWWVLFFCFGSAVVGLIGLFRLSQRYGKHGLQKYLAARRVPKIVYSVSRTPFIIVKK